MAKKTVAPACHGRQWNIFGGVLCRNLSSLRYSMFPRPAFVGLALGRGGVAAIQITDLAFLVARPYITSSTCEENTMACEVFLYPLFGVWFVAWLCYMMDLS